MSSLSDKNGCDRLDSVSAYALRALSTSEARSLEEHIASCDACRAELAALRPIIESFATWPAEILCPSPSLWDQLVDRIAAETNGGRRALAPKAWHEPDWEDVAPGISCKLLSTDTQRDRVSMVVRLAPGTCYPPHSHAGVEELHLLQGELWIEDRLLYPGDYNRCEPGTSDRRVWSETGCTCLLITSPSDLLR